MQFLDLSKLTDTELLAAGKLLIAQPFMTDSTFSRSVIFLCQHGSEGALGFMLNQPADVYIGDLLPEMNAAALSVNQGGPVQLDTLHVLHRIPSDIGGSEVGRGVYWGASFDLLQNMLSHHTFSQTDIRLFIGYSGWSPGQLEGEIKEGSWLVADAAPEVVFEPDAGKVWEKAIYSLGNDYRYLVNMPSDPGLN